MAAPFTVPNSFVFAIFSSIKNFIFPEAS